MNDHISTQISCVMDARGVDREGNSSPETVAMAIHDVYPTRDMDISERNALLYLAGQPHALAQLGDEAFHYVLIEALRMDRLHELFCHGQGGLYHRGITPCSYNEIRGEIYPEEMARWRSDFRSMSPERQMMAATIVWLYRSGTDSIWLRRVPCTWSAIEALRYMKDAGSLLRWLRLLAYFPGW